MFAFKLLNQKVLQFMSKCTLLMYIHRRLIQQTKEMKQLALLLIDD